MSNPIDFTLFTQGTIGALIVEGVKLAWKKLVVKDDGFEFNPTFYKIALPVANVLAILPLAILQVPGYELPMSGSDWLVYARLLFMTALSSVISMVVYNGSIRQFKNYVEVYNIYNK